MDNPPKNVTTIYSIYFFNQHRITPYSNPSYLFFFPIYIPIII